MLRCLVVLVVMMLAGCRQKAPLPPPQTLEALASRVTDLLQAGNTNAAVAELDAGVKNPAFEAQRGSIFRNALLLRLQMGRVDETRRRYLDVIGKAPELERAGYVLLSQYYAARHATNALLEWRLRLADAPLVQDLRKRAALDCLETLHSCGDTARIGQIAVASLSRFQQGDTLQVLGQALRYLLESGAIKEAGSLLATIEKRGAGDPEMMGFARMSRIEWLFAQERWAEAEAAFTAALPGLSDGALERGLPHCAAAAARKEKWDLADRFCSAVMARAQSGTSVANVAAAEWVGVAVSRKSISDMLDRLNLLRERGFRPDVLAPLYMRNFYAMTDTKDAAVLERLLKTGETLLGMLGEESDKAPLRAQLFDASFLAQDYDRTLAYLKEGMPGRDEAWMRMAENKVLAHRALKEGRQAEAVERFRQFMKDLSDSWNGIEADPSTGLRYSKEMALGFNSARIGKILKEAGNTAGAEAAFGEARSLFQVALTNLDAKSREHAYVREQLAALPPAAGAGM